MKKMPRLKWDQAYSVHNETIDAEHKKLFDIVNNVIEFQEKGSGDLLPVISDLVDYLSYHFNTEHMVMMNMDYPGFFEHNNDHQRFTEKIHEFLKNYEEDKKDLAFEMLNYLSTWVDNHTLKMDKKYGEYLHRTGVKPRKSSA